MTIEQLTADTILQKGEQTLEVGDKTYQIGKPTVATLIMVSELISQIPEYTNNDNIVSEVLAKAKDTKVLGKIVATLILGAKRVKEHHKVTKEIPQNWLLRRFKPTKVQVIGEEVDVLAEEILDNCSPSELSVITSVTLSNLEIGAFFAITTSLMTTNVLKPTK